ncbi:MAG: hypothetical protein QOG80_1489 [Pseudonocardiales bacterium]|jgi:hypothetical protein|nr:hypothetical protein [Pseudonocardiales bacterium]
MNEPATGVPTATPDDAVGYIRGGGVQLDTRRVVRAAVALCLVGLAVLAVVLSIAAVHENARSSALQRRGVPVDVTVTGCVGLASGTGITVYAYTCRGTFVLDGYSYNDAIGGLSDAHTAGEKVRGVADPRSPSTLSSAAAVAHTQSPWKAFIAPAVPLLLLVSSVALIAWRYGRAPHSATSR